MSPPATDHCAASLTRPPRACSAPFSPPKLPTPRRGLPAPQLPAVKVPPLKLPSSASSGASAAAALPVPVDENAAANAAAAAAAAGDKAGGKKKGAMRFLPGAKKVTGGRLRAPALCTACMPRGSALVGRGVSCSSACWPAPQPPGLAWSARLFAPAHHSRYRAPFQAAKKAAAPLNSQPQLALEVPLGSGRGAGSTLPRLPFDAGAAMGTRLNHGEEALRVLRWRAAVLAGAPPPWQPAPALTHACMPNTPACPCRPLLQPTTTWTAPAAAALWRCEAGLQPCTWRHGLPRQPAPAPRFSVP